MAAHFFTTSTVGRASAGSNTSFINSLRETLSRWNEKSRLRTELRTMSQRDLADLGLRESDIEDVVRGTYGRP